MRVAIVHDDLVQWGGAERVLEAICEIYPDAPIYTSVFDQNNKELAKRFGNKKIQTSFLQIIPGWKTLYKGLLPFYPIAFEQFDFSGFNLVISNTTRFAKSIITKPGTTHVCYCHTPPRFLWHFSGETSYGWLELLMSKLRIYDVVSARRVDYFLAGSGNAKRRIKKIYRMDSKVVYPFIDLGRFMEVKSSSGDYFVIVGRPTKYKRFDLAIKTCKRLNLPLKIISGGLEDAEVIKVLADCKALIIPGEEDFGITALEAQALGKPVIAYRKGGAMETVIEGKTGIFFDEQTIESLSLAIIRFNSLKNQIKAIDCCKNAASFSKASFLKNFKQVLANLG